MINKSPREIFWEWKEKLFGERLKSKVDGVERWAKKHSVVFSVIAVYIRQNYG